MTETSRFGAREFAAAIVGLLFGICIGYVDSRATWDDAGVTAAALVATAGLLGAARPRAWWLIGLAVGLPVVAFNVAIYGRFSSAIAVAFALLGAAAGASTGRAFRRPFA
jgi:hypothetical protein